MGAGQRQVLGEGDHRDEGVGTVPTSNRAGHNQRGVEDASAVSGGLAVPVPPLCPERDAEA